MTIRLIPDTKDMCANVYLRDGKKYLGADITPKPFGECERCVSFWWTGALIVIPMDLVESVEIYQEES